MRRVLLLAVATAVVVGVMAPPAAAQIPTRHPTLADILLDRAIQRFVATPGASPGIGVVVHRGANLAYHTAGVANVQTRAPFRLDDHMRLASVSKAISGAVALRLVSEGRLSLDTTIGQRRPDLPAAWHAVTLRQLLNHTSGIPDFSEDPQFLEAVIASLQVAPPPRQLLSFVEDEPLLFPPGSRYQYSNSDNIIVGLMAEAATGRPYEELIQRLVAQPLGLTRTFLPRGPELPEPAIHGYDPSDLEDLTTLVAAGWSWASGGVVSTPRDADRFIRAYASGVGINNRVHAQQFRFIEGGSSEPPGPGVNAAGLAIFRYQTSCGTVYGHTGNTPGYTQFIAATADGTRSTVVSVNAQITPTTNARRFPDLRQIFEHAVCAALAPERGSGIFRWWDR